MSRPGGDPLRVLLVTNRFPTDTAPFSGTFVLPLRNALTERGLSIEILHIDRRRAGRVAYARAGRSVRIAVGRFEPHVVHVLWGGVLAWRTVSTIRERPVVVTFGGTDLLGLYATLREGPLAHLARFLAVTASRAAARRADHIVLASRSLVAALPRGIAADGYSVVSSGVDGDRFRPLDRSACRKNLDWEPCRKHILFPASARRSEKRFDLARQALSELERRGHDAELHPLESVPHADVPIWMNAADVVLITSRHEGSPRALKEALACGRPVVSVDVGDARELVDGLGTCRIAAPAAGPIADSIAQVWNAEGHDSQARDRMRRHAWPRAAAELERVYRLCATRAPVR